MVFFIESGMNRIMEEEVFIIVFNYINNDMFNYLEIWLWGLLRYVDLIDDFDNIE